MNLKHYKKKLIKNKIIKNILLVGYGTMGGALKRALEPYYSFKIIQPNREGCYNTVQDLPKDYFPDIVLWAVKPQILPHIIQDYAYLVEAKTFFISVAAGLCLNFFQKHLGKTAHIVRAMPNLAIEYGFGITGLLTVFEEDKKKVEDLFKTTGLTLFVENDTQLDSITALCGSGPAFFFRFIESFEKAAQNLNFSPQISSLLAHQTMQSAAALLRESKKNATDLKEKVTSPHGTTFAGLTILSKDIDSLVDNTIQAAFRRAQEINNVC